MPNYVWFRSFARDTVSVRRGPRGVQTRANSIGFIMASLLTLQYWVVRFPLERVFDCVVVRRSSGLILLHSRLEINVLP